MAENKILDSLSAVFFFASVDENVNERGCSLLPYGF